MGGHGYVNNHLNWPTALRAVVINTLSVVVCLCSFTATSHAGFGVEATRERLARELYLLSGYAAVVNQIDKWVEGELAILAETNEMLSPRQLWRIQMKLESDFNTLSIRKKLIDRLKRHLSLEQLQRLVDTLGGPVVKEVMVRDGLMEQSLAERGRFEEYKVRIQAQPALESRLDHIRALSIAQGGRSLEVVIRVELRKSLLRALTYVKKGESISEDKLELVVEGYRQVVLLEGGEKRLVRNLYLFRHAPNAIVAQYTDALEGFSYQSWLNESLYYLGSYFTRSRSFARL